MKLRSCVKMVWWGGKRGVVTERIKRRKENVRTEISFKVLDDSDGTIYVQGKKVTNYEIYI